MAFVEVAGQKTYYVQRQAAARPAVVFVHGAGGSHQQWLYQVRDLAVAARFAPDLPGHGRSAGAPGNSIAAYGDWLVGFLDRLGLDRAVLVGHSMGGAIVLDVALRFPQRAAGLGLVSTGARLRVAPAILDGLRDRPQEAIRLIVDYSFAPEVPPEVSRLGREQMAATDPAVLYGDFAACDAFDLRERLGEIAVPAVVVCGTQDRMTPLKAATILQQNLADARLHIVEGAGHMLPIEQPHAVTRALAALLDRL